MPNIIDYIKWRGDLSMEVAPFCEIDALILCQITYLPFDTIVPSAEEKTGISMEAAAGRFFNAPDVEKRSALGILINKKTPDMFKAAAACVRYRDIPLFAYKAVTETETTKQFAALSFALPGKTVFTAYRGTDDTITGWKEDFAMAYMSVIPAQQEALEYLNNIAVSKTYPAKKIITGGHSKGGNLAMYAAAKCRKTAARKVKTIYNFDGPGFSKEQLESKGFDLIHDIIYSYTPEMSIVGMLFEQLGKFTIVASTEKAVMQHDPLSWILDGPSFSCVKETSPASKFIDQTIKTTLASLNMDKRRILVNTVFEIIETSDARSLTDMKRNGFDTSKSIIGALGKTDPTTKDMILQVVRTIFKAARENIPSISSMHRN